MFSSSKVYFVYYITDLAVNTLYIYRDKHRTASSQLRDHMTMEECGFVGSNDWYIPVDVTLYYDYPTEYYKCPLIMSDHYFINRKKHATAT